MVVNSNGKYGGCVGASPARHPGRPPRGPAYGSRQEFKALNATKSPQHSPACSPRFKMQASRLWTACAGGSRGLRTTAVLLLLQQCTPLGVQSCLLLPSELPPSSDQGSTGYPVYVYVYVYVWIYRRTPTTSCRIYSTKQFLTLPHTPSLGTTQPLALCVTSARLPKLMIECSAGCT